jgi:hypothetical protein
VASSTAKKSPLPGHPSTTLDLCHTWVKDCIQARNRIVVPAIVYYETLRELERLDAVGQIARFRAFCFAVPDRYLSITDADIDLAAKLWGQIRNAGLPTASPEALDGDVILAAQVLGSGVPMSDIIVATTNVDHLSRFVAADNWTNISP